MRVCFASYRPFPDGPVKQPFMENDPANIASALAGDYLSFYTLAGWPPAQLARRLRDYDHVRLALDVEAIGLVNRILAACPGRGLTYSEGHASDYQRLEPTGQIAFVQALNAASIHLVYWEKGVPLYQALTATPVEYL